MKNASLCSTVALALVAAACEDARVLDRGPPRAAPPPSLADGAIDRLWTRYRNLHVLVTEGNTEWIGRHLERLLGGETRAVIDAAVARSVSGVRDRPLAAGLSATSVRHRILGESALVHQDRVTRATLRGVWRAGEDRAVLVVDDRGQAIHLPVVRERGEWRFAPSTWLVASPEQLFPLPARSPPPALATPDALAAALVAAVASGTGWSLYDLIDDGTRARIRQALAAAGAEGSDEAAVRALDRALRGLRRQHGVARIRSIAIAAPGRAAIALEFADGAADTFTAVRQEQGWRLVLAL